jgi:hypothetical protein
MQVSQSEQRACFLYVQELERRYNTFGSAAVSAADAAAAAKAAAADLSLVLGFLSQRGWADLSVPNSSSSSGMDAGAQQELDEQLDEVGWCCVSLPVALHAAGLTSAYHTAAAAVGWMLAGVK